MKKKFAVGLFLMGSLSCTAVFAAEVDLEKASQLMKSGKAAEAYELLAAAEFEMSGNIKYDYLLGIAALDSGKPDKATLAFERVLAINPNHAGARLDMARAYFALGDYKRANAEFETVLSLSPPPAARATVLKYKEAIEARESAKKTTLVGYVEAVAGNDNNVTSVTSNFTSGVQGAYNFSNVQPTGNSIQRKDDFLGVAAGMEVNHAVNNSLGLYAGLDARKRDYLSESKFSSESLDERLGLAVTEGPNLYKAGFQFQQYSQAGDTPPTPPAATGPRMDRDSTGISGEWRRLINARNQVGLLLQHNRQRYPDTPSSNVDQTVLGATWLGMLAMPGKPILFGSLTFGEDKAQNKLNAFTDADVSKEYYGARLYGQYSLNEKMDIFVGLGYQKKSDQSRFARSTVTEYGKDDLADVSLGLNWRPLADWTVRPQVVYTRNDSNIELYSFDRTEASITVRRDFR